MQRSAQAAVDRQTKPPDLYLIIWITTHLPTPEGWMAELVMLADR